MTTSLDRIVATPRGSEPADVAAAARGTEADVEKVLRQAIQSGRFKIGERLPTERDLAAHFETSRTAVRRVLSGLESAGLIYRRVGCGTFVNEVPASPGVANVDWRDAGPKEVMEARLAVEPAIARLFVQNASTRNEERLILCMERSEAARSFEEFERWDEALHETIVAGTHNPIIAEWYRSITSTRRNARWTGMKRRVYTGEYRARIEEQHRALVWALRDRNADAAAEAARVHLNSVRATLFPI